MSHLLEETAIRQKRSGGKINSTNKVEEEQTRMRKRRGGDVNGTRHSSRKGKGQVTVSAGGRRERALLEDEKGERDK